MIPDLGAYVYLSTLEQTHPQYATMAHAYSTFNINKTYIKEDKFTTAIEQAVNVLKNAAATEAVKEQQAIKNYTNKIKKFLNSNKKIPKTLKQNLELQLQHIKTLDINSYQHDQLALIQSLNIAIQNIHSYKRRLTEINLPVAKNVEFSSRFEQGLQPRVNHFLQNRKSSSRNRNEDIRRDVKLEQSIRKEIKKLKLNFPQLENELESIIFIDFNYWLVNNPELNQAYETISPEEIQSLYNIYQQQSNNSLTETHFQRILRESEKDDKELLQLLYDMKSTLRSTYLTDKEYKEYKAWVEEKKKIGKEDGKRKIHGVDYSFKQITELIETYNTNTQKTKNQKYVFTLGTSTSQGNFYERMITFIRSAFDVKGNVAADLILPVATVTFSINEQDQQKILMDLSKKLSDTMTTSFEKEKQLSIDQFNDMVENQRQLHNKLMGDLSTAETNIQDISTLGENFFIAHETTKLYRSAEQKKNNRIIDEFHGRKMKVMSSLAKLYASDQLSYAMIGSEELITYLLNIHEDTLVGKNNLEPLETYLSLFAGLLMFDDIKDIVDVAADDIIKNLNLSTINQLHVYNLGGVYYPVSIILYNLIEQLENGINTINSIDYSKTAIVNIIPPSSLSIPETSNINDWKELANTTIHNTEIQIHFLQGFNAYIKDLLGTYNA